MADGTSYRTVLNGMFRVTAPVSSLINWWYLLIDYKPYDYKAAFTLPGFAWFWALGKGWLLRREATPIPNLRYFTRFTLDLLLLLISYGVIQVDPYRFLLASVAHNSQQSTCEGVLILRYDCGRYPLYKVLGCSLVNFWQWILTTWCETERHYLTDDNR